ncbi:hypothetical protein AVEN_172493-1 [Araneus ventricosus]|uniref:Uncharacterized protein n=1 Tax=Araneus ventricosus TaxID=182803 RepID=A0A4Y2DQC2_ARAVE|nr:hypothetical protein AVEN_172493-1 [Araneus ventricosus]
MPRQVGVTVDLWLCSNFPLFCMQYRFFDLPAGSSSKSPIIPSTSSSAYLPQLGMDGEMVEPQHHRLVHSPLLPSSSALSQQLPQFPPLDSPQGSDIMIENGIVLEGPNPSVISLAPNNKQQ